MARLKEKSGFLDKALKKDFRDFRRSIDEINLNLATKYFKNTLLDNPKDARLIVS